MADATGRQYAAAQDYHEGKSAGIQSAIVVRFDRRDAARKIEDFNYQSGVRTVRKMRKSEQKIRVLDTTPAGRAERLKVQQRNAAEALPF